MPLQIITADQRMAERSGVKAVIFGPYKIGKTSLLRTLDADRTLFLNIEAGGLAVQDVPVAEIRPEGETQWSWPDLRNLAALLGGPNPALAPDRPYSVAHYGFAVQELGQIDLSRFETYFIDSITVASRICMAWALQQPDAFSEKTGKPDVRGAYGLLGREMTAWITQLQHARAKNVIFVGLLDQVKDDYGRMAWEPQMDGQAAAKALPGIVDQVLTLQMVAFEEGAEPVRCFVTKQNNPWGFPAGDRSGRLDLVEEPHLGRLIAKVADQGRARHSLNHELPQSAA